MKCPACFGTEYRLKDCGYTGGGDTHTHDWSITCNNSVHKNIYMIT